MTGAALAVLAVERCRAAGHWKVTGAVDVACLSCIRVVVDHERDQRGALRRELVAVLQAALKAEA